MRRNALHQWMRLDEIEGSSQQNTNDIAKLGDIITRAEKMYMRELKEQNKTLKEENKRLGQQIFSLSGSTK